MDLHRTLLAAALFSVMGTAQAADLAPIAARAIDLGAVSGLAYYTVEDDGYHVVATLDASDESAAIRFETVLTPGQRLVLSSPQAVGVAAETIEISREDDRLVIRPATVTH